ncbi:MAG: T9SS type A sorting domain-containing protein [Candidatus Krumholzibacteriia bacterium]
MSSLFLDRRRTLGPRLALVLGALLLAWPAAAWVDLGNQAAGPYNPHGAFVTDGSYVMNVGELQVNITNWGLIGSRYSNATTYSDAPSAQWPAGSGNEYLWGAGLWVGGVLLGERLVSTGQYENEFLAQDNPEDTIYEAIGTKLVRPPGNADASGRRYPEPDPNDDEDVDDFGVPRVDEEILNGYDDDGDGLIDEDFGQIGNQMMVTTMYDNTRLASEFFPDHTPLNLRVVQESYAWESDQVDDFVGFQYTITNVGVSDINSIYVGFFADPDIGPRSGTGTASDDMAGSYSGAWKASDGSWVPVEVGFMWDAAEEGRLDGYFGIAFLGHDTDPEGRRAPQTVRLRTFQRFSGQAPFDQGGDPVNDSQRYELLSAGPEDWDPDVQPGKQDDFRFMISAGPFEVLESGADLQFQVALAAGSGLNGLLSTCAEAALTWYGNYFNRIEDQPRASDPSQVVITGENGRETLLCMEDFAEPSVFFSLYPDYGDTTCVDQSYLLQFGQVVDPDVDVFKYRAPGSDREKNCAMFNMDNCFECFRQKPHSPGETSAQARCSQSDIETFWNCNNETLADFQKVGCTGLAGNESEVHWLVGMAPPPPGLRLWPTDTSVHVYWDNESEVTPDVRLGAIDFESYRIWRADNWTRPYGSSIENGPGSNLWQLIAEYDVVDSFLVNLNGGSYDDAYKLPLGPNTGLEVIRYTPRVLSDPAYAGLAEAMQAVVDADPGAQYTDLPPLYDQNGNPLEISLPLLPWQGYPDVLDTFWAVASRPESLYVDPVSGDTEVIVFAKAAKSFYEYVDPSVHNGFIYFYSVTATDHELEYIAGSSPPQYRIVGPGQSGDPSSSFDNGSPATEAQTAAERAANGANIFVYPNPATRESLREFQQLFAAGDDPTGVRVRFANLPAAHNTIKIYTLSGDLVETIDHDGTGGYGEASWNLISRNGQEIVSGIYLYVVQSDDGSFDDFIGKFVVVR